VNEVGWETLPESSSERIKGATKRRSRTEGISAASIGVVGSLDNAEDNPTRA